MHTRHNHLARAILTAALFGLPALASAETVHARLVGYEEVPAVSSPGSGEFRAKIDDKVPMITYELSYEDLQGTPFMAHIHFGQRSVSGGISVWLCGNGPAPVPPAGTPACPVPGGTVTGTIVSGNVIGPDAQLIAPTELGELIAAIRAGAAYVNVHTLANSGGVPSGEIRGQIR